LWRNSTRKKARPRLVAFAKSTGQRQETLTDVRSIAFVIIAILFFFSSCEWFGPAEKYKTEPNRTTYRAAEEKPTDAATPAPQKIPGESRR